MTAATVIAMYTAFYDIPSSPFAALHGGVTLVIDPNVGRTLAYVATDMESLVVIDTYDADELLLDERDTLYLCSPEGMTTLYAWAWLTHYRHPTAVPYSECPVSLHHYRKGN
tara:strand:- start:882 stop:1217 length:336 start_codon:yes stop_codon:yes gene_type:complete